MPDLLPIVAPKRIHITGSPLIDMSGVDHIEVIKGPNSALFGFNAIGGVINIVTYNPIYDKIDTVRGMDITICTSGRTDDEGRALLRALGFPFRRTEAQG